MLLDNDAIRCSADTPSSNKNRQKLLKLVENFPLEVHRASSTLSLMNDREQIIKNDDSERRRRRRRRPRSEPSTCIRFEKRETLARVFYEWLVLA